MSFPEWAPAKLVDEFNRLQVMAASYLVRADEVEREGDYFFDYCPAQQKDCKGEDQSSSTTACVGGCPEHRIDYKVEAAKTAELANTLHRLLTDHSMKAVWATLSRPVVDHRYEGNGEYLLWDAISRALKDFPKLIATLQTPAQRAKRLQSVRDKAQALLDAIAVDPTASRIGMALMAEHLSIKNNIYRQKNGDTLSQANFLMPLTLSSDCDEAHRVFLESDDDEESSCWTKKPLVSRLAYWAKEAEETRLDELLRLFIDWLQAAAEQSPEIKQPGRGDAAIKPFLIRRASEYMTWCYGQPLDEAVARIVSIVLDLKVPLTRDDVRPFIAGTGKKSG